MRLQRMAAIASLQNISSALRSDLLADHVIATRFGLNLTSTISLSERANISRDDLFAAFGRAIIRNRKVALKDDSGALLNAQAWVDASGTGIVEMGTMRWLFAHASLLQSSGAKRREYANACLCRHTLGEKDTATFLELVGKPTKKYEDAFAAMLLLSSSPETFGTQFRERLEKARPTQGVTIEDLLPEDIRYWDHLVPVPDHSTTRHDYVTQEWQAELRRRFRRSSLHAYETAALAFAAPGVVPFDLFDECSSDALLEMIEPALRHDGHFALLGAFEMCAKRAAEDHRFAALGDRVIDLLFSDIHRLERTCALFVPTFVIATAFLAEHEALQSRPVFWRRLAAAAHASLIVRACGIGKNDYANLIAWSMRMAGNSYFLSVFADMGEEPNWRPEWIRPDFLVADAFGRARNALNQMGPSAPVSWRQKIEAAEAWVLEKKLAPLTTFPAVLEGARRSAQLTASEMISPFADALTAFATEPSVDRLVKLGAIIYSFGLPADIYHYVPIVLERIRHDDRNLDDSEIQIALALSAHVAVHARDAKLADMVADIIIEKLHGIKTHTAFFEAISRLVECSGANIDRDAARQSLATRLENVAFTFPASPMLHDLTTAIQTLKSVQPTLASMLGKAFAAARLGASAIPTQI